MMCERERCVERNRCVERVLEERTIGVLMVAATDETLRCTDRAAPPCSAVTTMSRNEERLRGGLGCGRGARTVGK